MGIPHALFEEKLEYMKSAKGYKLDTELTASDLKELVEEYKSVYVQTKGEKFPSGTLLLNLLSCGVLAYNALFVHIQIQRSSWSWLSRQFSILGTARGRTSIGA